MAERRLKAEESEKTRLKLLDVGLAMLADQPPDLFGQLDPKPVSSRAGFTTGADHYHFASVDEYAEALLHYALENEVNPPFAAALAVFEPMVADGASFRDAFISGCVRLLEFSETNRTFTLQMAVWARRHRDIHVPRRLQRMYEMVDAETGQYYEAMLPLLGREMRPPFSVLDLADSFGVVFEGLALRRGVSTVPVTGERLASLLIPILVAMTRSVGEEIDAEEWLATHAPGWAT